MKEFYTYLHCKPDGTPFYVGKGSSKRSHDFRGRNSYYKNVVNKYGVDNILVFVFPCNSEKQAFSDEVQQIAQLREEGFSLCNMTDGGDGISNPTPEIRKKISETLTGRKNGPCPPETKAKISKANKGTQPSEQCRLAALKANTGRKLPPFSAERRFNMSEAKKNPSAETTAKRSAALTGRVMSKESRDRMSKAKKGKPWTAAQRAGWEARTRNEPA